MAKPQNQRRPPPPRRRRAANRPRSAQTVQQRLAGHFVIPTSLDRAPTISIKELNTIIGVLLVPVAAVTTVAFFQTLSQPIGQGWWQQAAVVHFICGLVTFIISFLAGFRPRYLYVVGHELTHALVAKLCGAKIIDIAFSRDGGYVITDRTNLAISLSPYFIPFWALAVTALYGLLGVMVDFHTAWTGVLFGWGRIDWPLALCLLLGYTWGGHLCFTLWMMRADQPDLDRNGYFFSIVLIWLVNQLLIAALFIGASPEHTWTTFWDVWMHTAHEWWQSAGHWLSAS